ncbi:hypothetical protein QQ045_014497 [Rhodiola kirilowii]
MVHTSVPFRATLFYGAPKASLRYKSWELLRKLAGLSLVPWCIFGDFNEILSFSETSQTAVWRGSALAQFRSVVDECNLFDLGFKGCRFTYSNKRQDGAETRCRLDRALATEAWRLLFPDAVVHHLATFHSDHSPIQLCLLPMRTRSPRMFRYEAMWDRDPRFKDLLKSLWDNQADHLSFLQKLQNVKRPVLEWNHKIFGMVDKQLQVLRDALVQIRQCPRTDDNIDKERQVARNAPVLTHLFFADDSLLLFEATTATPSIIKSVLTEYERLAGQRVNYGKSELVLSPNASVGIKQSFLSSLSAPIVDGHKRYLGLPLHLGRKISANFLQLLDRVHVKSKPWYTSALSCGGREVLIKSVLLAIPQYHMQCFRIPKDAFGGLGRSNPRLCIG